MAKITTIINPLTGQPVQVDQLDHTAQQIDDGIGFESTDYPGCYYRMVGSVVEWFNPPMLLGVEYRTTERYLSKSVYIKTVNFGTPPASGDKTVEWGSFEYLPVSYRAVWGTTLLPYDDGDGLNIRVRSLTGLKIVVNDNYDWSGQGSILVTIKYTKTTD